VNGFVPALGLRRALPEDIGVVCGFLALVQNWGIVTNGMATYRFVRGCMQKVALAMVLVIGSITLGGCFVGKGKAPPSPPPIVRKG
jgi:hypothetical protein